MNHHHGKHLLLMLACCLIPIALILAISIFGVSLGALTPFIPFALALMCPLMMIFMMRDMMGGHSDEHARHHLELPAAKSDALPEQK